MVPALESKLAKLRGSVMELVSLSVFDEEWGEVVVLVVGIAALGGKRLAAAHDRRQAMGE
jgi:hypothetical protein